MTTTTDQQVQVQAYVAGTIITRLNKLGASEEANVRKAAATQTVAIPAPDTTAPTRHHRNIQVPQTVVSEVIAHLGTTGQIRRFSYRGVRFIANAKATTEELTKAMQRTFGTFSVDEKQHATSARSAEALSFFDTTDRIHQSETEDGCLAIQSVTDQLTAETTPWETSETTRLAKLDEVVGQYAAPKHSPLSPEAAAKVAKQLRIGQGPRNTQRVEHARKQAFLQSDRGADWLQRQRSIDDAKMDISLSDPQVEATSALPEDDDDVFSVAFG